MEYLTGVKPKETKEISELLEQTEAGTKVKVNGAVHTIRDMGTVAFVILRKREGLLQCVYEEGSADFELKDIKGNIHHLSDYKGKYIILDFWSRYCGPCLDAFPLLKEIAEKYKEKVVVISLSVDPEAVWKKTEVKESADNWLQLSDGLGMSGIAAHYGVHALPSFIYIPPEITVLKAGQGYKFLSEDIRTFIKDK